MVTRLAAASGSRGPVPGAPLAELDTTERILRAALDRIARAAEVLRHEIPRKAWVRADMLEDTVDTLVRVILSHTLSPSPRLPARVARGLARVTALALTGTEGPPPKARRRPPKEGAAR